MISALAFTISIVCYSVSQLQQHGKLKWGGSYYGFWGPGSGVRKYKGGYQGPGASTLVREPAPKGLYYRFFKIKYKEAFPLSATFLVSLTDGYHLMQSIFFLSLSFGISQLINIYGVWDFPLVWLMILGIHWLTRRLAGK